MLILCTCRPLTATSLHPSSLTQPWVHFAVLQDSKPKLWVHRCQEPQPRAPTKLTLIKNTPEKYTETYFQVLSRPFPKWSLGTPREKYTKGPEPSPSCRMAFLKQQPQYGHHLLAFPLPPQFRLLSSYAKPTSSRQPSSPEQSSPAHCLPALGSALALGNM